VAEPLQPTDPPVPKIAKTEVIVPADAPSAQTVVIETPAPRKKRRRGIVALVVVVVVLVLLVVAFFIADAYAKKYAEGYVKERIIEVLKLDPATPITVDLGTGSILLQAVGGAIHNVDVTVKKVDFGALSGSATITATEVPLDGAKPLKTLDIQLTIPQDNVRALASSLSGSQLKQIDVGNGVIRIGTEFTVIFFTVPVSVDLVPSAKDGGISFDPKTVKVGDQEISVADLRANPEFSALAGDLLKSQTVCVASYLPTALKIDDVHVSHSDLVVGIKGDGVALGGSDLSTLGTCPAAK